MRLLIIDDDSLRVDTIVRYVGAASYVHEVSVPYTFDGFDVVTFDHDLGPAGDAYDALRCMDHENFPLITTYIVHSMNPVGARNIYNLLVGHGLNAVIIPFWRMGDDGSSATLLTAALREG